LKNPIIPITAVLNEGGAQVLKAREKELSKVSPEDPNEPIEEETRTEDW